VKEEAEGIRQQAADSLAGFVAPGFGAVLIAVLLFTSL
jgi:hypothetical protein